MTDMYEQALKSAIENLKTADVKHFLDFGPESRLKIQSRTLIGLESSSLGIQYFLSMYNYDSIIYSIVQDDVSTKEIARAQFEPEDSRACVAWLLDWLGILLKESAMMKRYGFRQKDFTSYELDMGDFAIRPRRMTVGGVPVVVIEETYALGLEQALISHARNHMRLSQIMRMSPAFRDRMFEALA